MKPTTSTSCSMKPLLHALMIVGIIIAFVGNEMVGHDAVTAGMLLTVTAVACAFSAMIGLTRTA